MDQTLLQNRVGASPEVPTDRGNNHQPETDTQHDQEFRDLVVDQPRPPLRMRLDPPLEYDGEKFSCLTFDFDGMIGKDFQRAEREFTKLYKPGKDEMVLPEMKHLYHTIIASHLANVPLGVIQKLPRRYYTPLRIEILKACGSSLDEEKE